MSKHVTISPEEAADRLAIRELVEAYAHCADRRGVYEREGSDALTGAAFTRGARSSFRGPEPVRRDHALPRADDNPHTDSRPRHRRNLLHAPSPYDQRWKTTADDCRSPVYGHVREDRRRVAIFRAPALRRLDRGTGTVMTTTNLTTSMCVLEPFRGRA
jgi:hypothetical protein